MPCPCSASTTCRLAELLPAVPAQNSMEPADHGPHSVPTRGTSPCFSTLLNRNNQNTNFIKEKSLPTTARIGLRRACRVAFEDQPGKCEVSRCFRNSTSHDFIPYGLSEYCLPSWIRERDQIVVSSSTEFAYHFNYSRRG